MAQTKVTDDVREVTEVDAAKITTGTIPEARITSLAASKLTGTVDNARISLDAAEIPDISTDKLTSGTIPDARLPSTALNSNVDLTTLSASNLTSGTLPDARFPATLPATSGVNLTALNATNLGSGTASVARGGTGAATHTANNVLVGNGTSAIASVAPGSSGNVLTSNGSAWTSAAPAGGGLWVLVGTQTASSSTSLTQSGLDTAIYTTHKIVLSGIDVSTACQLNLLWGPDAGIWTSTTYSWNGRMYSQNATTVDAEGSDSGGAETHIRMGALGHSSNDRDIEVNLYHKVNHPSHCWGWFMYTYTRGIFSGSNTENAAMTQVRVEPSTGNITGGRMSVWGLTHY